VDSTWAGIVATASWTAAVLCRFFRLEVTARGIEDENDDEDEG
jgi:hypothetical protein